MLRIKNFLIAGVIILSSVFMYQSAAADTTADVKKLLVGQIKDLVVIDPPSAAPVETFVNEADEKRTIKDFTGQVVVINFWATWCAPCVQEMGSLDKLAAKFKETDVKVIAISLDAGDGKAEKVKSFYEKQNIKNLGVYFDPAQDLYRAFKPRGLPSTFILNRGGNMVGKLDGPVVWDAGEVENYIRHYVDEK